MRNLKLRRLPEARKTTDREIPRDLLEVLSKYPSGLPPEELFREAGFKGDEVDEFYRELNALGNTIEEVRREDENGEGWPYAPSVTLRIKK
jgi:hypothetical protein